jgi:hypothetical protein
VGSALVASFPFPDSILEVLFWASGPGMGVRRDEARSLLVEDLVNSQRDGTGLDRTRQAASDRFSTPSMTKPVEISASEAKALHTLGMKV